MSPIDIAAAADRIRPYVRRTPLLDARIDGRRVLLKLEHLQLSGSFKVRGALNAMLARPGFASGAGGGVVLAPPGSAEGAGGGAVLARPGGEHVVTASGGNHGLGVATAAGLLGRAATVFVPETVPAAKARRIEAAGARLIRHGSTYAEAAAAAMAEAARPGCVYLPAYDDPAVIAGQGTVAAEVVAEVPEVDSIAVAVGGGGLAAGTALAAGPRRTVAVEPENCRCFADALAAGRPVDSEVDSVAASALGATRVGELPFAILQSAPVESVLVSDKELLTARDLLWDHFRLAVEPAAAVPFAAWRAGRVAGDLPCLIICGANTDWSPEN